MVCLNFQFVEKKYESHKTQHSFETEIALISMCRIRTSSIIEKKCKSCRYFVVPVCTSAGRTFITLLFLNEGVPLRRLNYSKSTVDRFKKKIVGIININTVYTSE